MLYVGAIFTAVLASLASDHYSRSPNSCVLCSALKMIFEHAMNWNCGYAARDAPRI